MCRLPMSALGISVRLVLTLVVALMSFSKAATSSKPAPVASVCDLAYFARRFMRPPMMEWMPTPTLRSGQAESRVSSVRRWNSSGNAWIMQSMRYCCAMSSLHDTICSMIFGSTLPSYISMSMPSSWLSSTRFLPTRSCSCWRSRSRRSLSRMAPWCCMRTHSLFISVKLRTTKSTASVTSPPASPSYAEPMSGSLSRVTCAR
mmetsp:Transcript_23312/g.58511  ORF Transcript_23312/g.58511 Transcript_23312/m.58511 type:complete len:203 (-) Transcript_23312:599-1207(-)